MDENIFDVYERLGHEVTRGNNKLHLSVQGVHPNENGGESYEVGFDYINAPISQEEGIYILLKIFDLYISYFDENKALLTGIVKYPVTIESLDVLLFIGYSDLREMNYPELALVTMRRGIVTYKTNEMGEDGYVHLKTLFTETYEEAVERAKEYKGPKPF